jgi:serine/threonine protein kinase
MIGAGDHVTLMDFGLVRALSGTRLTEAGSSVGTLEYMSPEQLSGEEVDARSDVYSLGIVVYEMLAGSTPFRGDTPFRVIQNVMHSPPPPLVNFNASLPTSVQREIERALSKNPPDRHRSAGEFAEGLYCASTGGDLYLVDAQGQEYRLRKGVTSIGRGQNCVIVINDHQISRLHAEINFQNESWLLTDLSSTNGSFVNEARLAPGQPVRLNPGDALRFGPTARFTISSGRATKPGHDDTLRTTRPTKLPDWG